MSLPWQCPDHPDAQILHSWDNNYTVWGDGYPRGGHTSNHKYECNECHIELAAPNQASDADTKNSNDRG